MPTTNDPVSVEEITKTLVGTNATMVDSFVTLLSKTESDLMTASNGSLQGEAEELLREIIQLSGKAIEQILSLQEELQTRFVESYFTDQD